MGFNFTSLKCNCRYGPAINPFLHGWGGRSGGGCDTAAQPMLIIFEQSKSSRGRESSPDPSSTSP